MKLIIAVIRPNKLLKVKEALEEIGVKGLTIAEVRGHGRQRGHREVFRGKEYDIDLVPKNRIEVAIPDDRLDKVVEAIRIAALTGDVGDGKIFVIPMENAYRVRTGETGLDAL
jgi:nitrogen regulatory protein P-II 2